MKIPYRRLAQYGHVKTLIGLERSALNAYKLLIMKMRNDIRRLMRRERLAKSDDPLEPGWTGEIPTIKVDVDELLAATLKKYTDALRWVMLGDAAGKDARAAAKLVGLIGKVTPGVVPAAYLDSLDANREHWSDLFGTEAPEIPPELVKSTISEITKRTGRFLDQELGRMTVQLTEAVDRAVRDHNATNLTDALATAHDDSVEQAADDAAEKMSSRRLDEEILYTANRIRDSWDTTVKAQVAQSSAAGSHQAMVEVFGADDPDVRVVWIEMEDERVCDFCHAASKRSDGTFIYYKLADFKPSGYNFSRKRSDWVLSVPPAHHRCRCQLVYVPRGFTVDRAGTLIGEKA